MGNSRIPITINITIDLVNCEHCCSHFKLQTHKIELFQIQGVLYGAHCLIVGFSCLLISTVMTVLCIELAKTEMKKKEKKITNAC